MRALVTGAAGFLASHLCDRLIRDAFTVIGMDNMITGSAANLAQLEGHPAFTLVRHDVSTFMEMPQAPSPAKPPTGRSGQPILAPRIDGKP